MSNIEEGKVDFSVENGIGIIEFFHPKSNSLPGSVLSLLAQTITKAGENQEVKVIVLKSFGEKVFCAGASFDELLSIKDEAVGKQFFMGFANVINAMRTCPKLIIGRVQGKAVGGGVGMASAVDYCLATENAAIKLSELAIGIGPFVVGPAVERKVGNAAFSELAINATEWQSAAWAKEKGLYYQIFSTLDHLDREVNKLALQLSKSSPEAMMLLKKAIWNGTENWSSLLESRAEMSGKLVLSDFTVNAINRFKAQ